MTSTHAPPETLPLASYKLRLHEGHVRIMPAQDADGRPFDGPGVDLRGEDAGRVLAELGPLRGWLLAREPGVTLRSVSVDLRAARVLVTLAPELPGERPRVLRFDAPYAHELIAAGAGVAREAAAGALRALERRRQRAISASSTRGTYANSTLEPR